ncbi:MAG: DUF1376 domain-containing protein [Bradyrhizobium sp.]|nr:DUF1376 domain-containing protein [Bradyrhizobium sp.]
MGKSPAFQFYPNDFLGSGTVQRASAEQVGAYLLLLCLDWQEDGFGFDETQLAQTCRLSRGSFRKAWQLLADKFPPDQDGRHRNPRLQRERKKQEEYRAKQAAKGRSGAAKRWGDSGARHSRGHGSGYSTGHSPAMAQAQPEAWPDDGIVVSRSSSEQPTASPRRKQRGAKRETWLTPIADAHEEIYGVGSFAPLAGRFAKSWSGLVAAHGAEKCGRVWAFSQKDESQRKFLTPEKVASRFADFDPDAPAFPEDGVAT